MFNLSMVTDILFDSVQNPSYGTEETYNLFKEKCKSKFIGQFKVNEEEAIQIKAILKEYRLYRTNLESHSLKLQKILNDSLLTPLPFGDFTCDMKNTNTSKTNGFDKLVNKMIVRR
jgi:hypothetical protein